MSFFDNDTACVKLWIAQVQVQNVLTIALFKLKSVIYNSALLFFYFSRFVEDKNLAEEKGIL